MSAVGAVALVLAWALLLFGRPHRHRRPTRLGPRLLRSAIDDRAEPTGSRRADRGVRTGRLWIVPVLGTMLATVGLGPVAGGTVLAGWAVRRHRRARRVADVHAAAVVDQVPEVIDLLSLAVGAGLNLAEAIAVVARWTSGPVGDALGAAQQGVRNGEPMVAALERARDRCGAPAVGLFAALLAAARHGSPLADALDRIAGDARADRRRAAEERARKVPVQLLFPLVMCVLPAFALLTVVPLLVSSLGTLG